MKWLDMKDIVNCVDTLSSETIMNRNDPKRQDDSKYVNFVFIGDSRVRQIFFNFVKVFYFKFNLIDFSPEQMLKGSAKFWLLLYR